MDNFSIRRATTADLDTIMRVEDACFEPTVRERRETFAERLAAFPEGNYVLIADARGDGMVVAGYLCAELWTEKPAPESDAWKLGHSAAGAHDGRGTVLYISSLAVDPAFRGHGAGRALFRESIGRTLADCPWVRTITFIVSEAWASARALYETEGFAYTGRIAGFFGDADALIMEREQ